MTYSFDYKTKKPVEEKFRECPGDKFVISWIPDCRRRAASGYEPCKTCNYQKIDSAKIARNKNREANQEKPQRNWMEEAYNVTHD